MTINCKALVVGIADYRFAGRLQNPVNDANDIADSLTGFGFDVTVCSNCDAAELQDEITRFSDDLRTAQVGLFFFAGHGIQVDGENYLVAVDSAITSKGNAKYTSVALSLVLDVLDSSPAETRIVILDACRDNPFASVYGRSIASRGLAPIYAPRGSIIAFATSPGQTASDNPRGRNGSYTTALLQHIGSPDVPIETMFKYVRNTLNAATNGEQISWEHTSLSGNFYFNPSVGARIDIYSATALEDSLLVIDDTKPSHKLIRALKSLDWYKQNPALENFSIARARSFNKTSLFIIGRNIYQAACGSANVAQNYIENFMQRTQGLEHEKRKALLDGMLFEVFFDSRGQFRTYPKTDMFSELFALQERAELVDSFDFISECLLPNASRFYSLPGRTQPIGVDVIVSGEDDRYQVNEVYFAGRNILDPEDTDFVGTDGLPLRYRSVECDNYISRLSQEMLVPRHLLTVTFNVAVGDSDELRVPRGYTTAKW